MLLRKTVMLIFYFLFVVGLLCPGSYSVLRSEFYQNENFVSSTEVKLERNSVITIRLDRPDDCESVFAMEINANSGTVNFFKSENSDDVLMSLQPFQIPSSEIDSHVVEFVSAAEFPDNYRTKLFAAFSESFRNYSQFTPTAYAIINWRLEQSTGSSTDMDVLISEFQVFLATNGSSTLISFLYAEDRFQWLTPSSAANNPTMGIRVCSQEWNHTQSQTDALVDDLISNSNINVPGEWMFMIQNNDGLILPVPCSDGCSFDTGTCHVPDTCSCFNGWEGPTCTTPSCPGGCVNGDCNEPFVCTCHAGWLRNNCTVAECSEHCINGMCEVPNVCKCDDGWTDGNCTTPICTNGCGNGTCVGPDDCDCFEGYIGEVCDVVVCLGGRDCKGYCNVPGECLCYNGTTGVLCEIEITQPPTEPTEEPTDNGGGGGGGNEETDTLSGAAIGGIVAGIIGFVILVIALVFFIFCVLCCFYS